VALIPDGTRRWARKNGVPLADAYEAVSSALARTGTALFRHNLSSVSIYALSAANLRRKPDELFMTFASHTKVINGVLVELARDWRAQILHVGDGALLPAEYNEALEQACRKTVQYSGKRTLYICAGYSVEWELAFRSNTAHSNGWQATVPASLDMLIRTGGELRLSGFLPLQLQYAELFFLPKLFPDTGSEDIEQAIRDYHRRERRFGL
jgi:undecaprenyl pyrophosphate synthase